MTHTASSEESADRDRLLGAAADALGQAVVICDATGQVQVASARARELLGPVTGTAATQIDAVLAGALRAADMTGPGPLAAAVRDGAETDRLVALRSGAGPLADVRVRVRPLVDGGRRIGAVLALTLAEECDDDDGGEEADDRLRFGRHDPLTGLANRHLLARRLQQMAGQRRRVALLMIDLDRFKHVNDEHGHEFGDAVLREVSGRFAQTLRPGDTLARLGGDEFVAVCEVAAADDGSHIASRLLEAARRPMRVRGVDLVVGASIGVTVAPAGTGLEEMFHQVDLAMYEAKRLGRDRWTPFAGELARVAHRRARLESELRAAVEGGHIALGFQPMVDLRSGRIRGYEALVRWFHPELGLIPPVELIDVAEQSDLILRLGDAVMARACQVAASWSSPAGPGPLISVNLSAREAADPRLVGRVGETLSRSGLEAERLCLEFTETSLIEATPTMLDGLAALRSVGVRLAIDDFGTGFASLAYLRRLPVNELKIDRTFVAGLPTSLEDDAIITSVLGLAHNLGLRVVAEGIETKAQLSVLRTLGCDIGQGYLFGRARPADEVVVAGPAP